MNYTQNYHLGLPIPAERYDVSIVNANNTVIDGQLKTNADAITNHKNDHNNPHGVTAAQVGLGNVNNTADSAKPVSTPQSQYIASAVATEATRATNAEGALSDRITTAAGEISAEVTRATGVESTLSTQITNEVTRAQGAESGLRDYVDEKLSVTYKASGSVFFADLPALAASREGHVYNIKDAFTTTADFVEGAGKDYPAGTNVAIVEKDEESYEVATVEEGDNPSEMGLYELSGTDYVLTEDTVPVEGKTYYELVVTPAYYYDVLAGFIDTSDFVTNTDYSTTQTAGIVKPDGTTITVDANGVISSQGGGGDVSSEEISNIVNILGSKNLNSYPYYDGTSISRKGITYTANRDTGIITVNGTSTGSSYYTCHYDRTYCELLLPNGQYILSGCPSQSGEPKYGIDMWVKKNGGYVGIAEDIGEGATFVIDGDDTYTNKARVVIQIFVKSGVSIDHMLFKPMIRPSHIEDDTFAPYTQTNNELTSNMFALKSKNILFITAKSQTINGVSFTVDDDGIITANGTASDDIAFYVGMFGIDDNDHEYYNFTTGCPEGSLSTYWFRCGESNWTKGMLFANIYASLVYICIKSGYTCDNLVFKLKIRKNTDWSNEYVPPAKSNRELTSEQAFIANNYGVKNLLKNSAVGQTVNGVTFTIDDDGVISCSGTSTDNIEFEIISEPLSFNYDVFIFYSAVLGGTGYSFLRVEYDDEQGEPQDRYLYMGSRENYIFRIPANSVITRIYIYISRGYTMNNDIHKLMICSCSTTDLTYVPYAKTNRQLTEDVEALQQATFPSDMTGATSSTDGEHGLVPAPLIADREKFLKGDGTWSGEIGDEISDIVNVLGAKNILPSTGSTSIEAGITYTKNSDGTITANGTASGTQTTDPYSKFIVSENVVYPPGTYILTGCPSGGSMQDYALLLYEIVTRDFGEGVIFTLTEPTTIKCWIVIYNAHGAVSNLVFKPMIRPASIKDDTYVPYAMPNKELMKMNDLKVITPTKTSVVNSFGFRKSGHIVSFYFSATPTAASFVDVFTNAPKLATGEMYFYGISSGGATLKTWCAVYSSGLIRLYVNASEVNATMIFSGTYISSE